MLQSRRFSRNDRLQKAAANTPPLAHGSTGLAVELLQSTLVEFGFPMPISTKHGRIRADGIYGSETTATVRKFQTQQGLSADGSAGRDTLHRLDQMQMMKDQQFEMSERLLERLNLWT